MKACVENIGIHEKTSEMRTYKKSTVTTYFLDSFQILESLEAQEPGNEVEGVILPVMATFGNIFGYLS